MNDVDNEQKPKGNVSVNAAILGLDIVSFSTLHDDDQIQVIGNMLRWIKEALLFHSIEKDDYRWSPAGDGGFLTFLTPETARKAVYIAFSIFEKLKKPDWRPREGEAIQMRMALHTGPIKEGQELGRETNIWGVGINKTARILTITAPDQLLVSKQYYDQYIWDQRENEFEISKNHWWRTVKHGDMVEVMNINYRNLCINEEHAISKRWQDIGLLWRKAVTEYKYLIHDSMKSGDPIAAITAGKFLLDLNEEEPVKELCSKIGNVRERDIEESSYPKISHEIFSRMSPQILFNVIKGVKPRIVEGIVCNAGDEARSCYFPVSGRMVVKLPNTQPIFIPSGKIVGEFSLWIPNLKRTATIEMQEKGLVLEITHEEFEKSLKNSERIRESIFQIIKDRIVENTLNSELYFPKLKTLHLDKMCDVEGACVCKTFDKDEKLDLTQSTYIIFNGSVNIYPDELNGEPFGLFSGGNFGAESVVGIVTPMSRRKNEFVDGAYALVMENTAAVVIEHDMLMDLQNKYSPIKSAWYALHGQRAGEIDEKAYILKNSN